MKFHTIDKAGNRTEVTAKEHLKLPMCRREKFMEAVNERREQRAAERLLRIHHDLEETAIAGLRLLKS